MNNRYVELDSLRGLASLFVMIGHLFMIMPEYANYTYNNNSPALIHLLKESPLRLIFSSGNESVILFFVLSGFVLSLPYYGNKNTAYSTYIIRRICRIYIPYACSIIIAILCKALLSGEKIPGLSGWFYRSWTSIDSPSLLLGHLFLIGTYNTDAYNNVIWSLVHEMRISLIYPVMMIPLQYRLKRSLFVLATIFAASSVLLALNREQIHPTSFLLTFHYCTLFLAGAYLAKYRHALSKLYRGIPFIYQILIIFIGFIFYLYEGWAGDYPFLNNLIFRNISIALGSCIFIILSLSSPMISSFLKQKALISLGKISYSLYLYHLISLLSLIHIFYRVIPVGLILVIAFISSIFIAGIAYKIFEKPSHRLGKKLTKGIVLFTKPISNSKTET